MRRRLTGYSIRSRTSFEGLALLDRRRHERSGATAVLAVGEPLRWRYDKVMARYSILQAQSEFPALVVAAERGEEVVIDQPDTDIVVKLVAHRVRPNGPHDVEWLRSVRVAPRRGRVNTAQLLKEAKDEGVR